MFYRLLSKIKTFRSYSSKESAILRNVGYKNTVFRNLKLRNVLSNEKGLSEGYNFQPTEISFSIVGNDENNAYSSKLLGYTEPMKVNFASYDEKVHQSHKKYLSNKIYKTGDIGKAGNWGDGPEFVKFNNCVIKSSKFHKITFYSSLSFNTSFNNNEYDNVTFEDCNFINTKLHGTNMTNVTFRNCIINNLNFEDLTINKMVFYDCKIIEATFCNILKMDNTYFQICKINGIEFKNVEMKNTEIYHSSVYNLKIDDVTRRISDFGFVDNSGIFVFDGKIQ
jgi:hypothetical protein